MALHSMKVSRFVNNFHHCHWFRFGQKRCSTVIYLVSTIRLSCVKMLCRAMWVLWIKYKRYFLAFFCFVFGCKKNVHDSHSWKISNGSHCIRTIYAKNEQPEQQRKYKQKTSSNIFHSTPHSLCVLVA